MSTIKVPNGVNTTVFELADGRQVHVTFIGDDEKQPFTIDVMRMDKDGKISIGPARLFHKGDRSETKECNVVSIDL